jgi:OmpA-OmpF porin, OOP family
VKYEEGKKEAIDFQGGRMNSSAGLLRLKSWLALSVGGFLMAAIAFGVTPSTRTFTAGEKAKVNGVIISREGDIIKVRGDDDSIGTVDITSSTKIQLKKGFLFRKSAMDANSLVPGLHVEAEGQGNDKGDLVADKVVFDPNSMRASRQIDTRVSPLESRTGTLEGRTGTLEGRAGQIEGRQTNLESEQKQTEQQVGQVKQSADQANQGVTDVNGRVANLDNYSTKYSATVYFKVNSSVLSPEARKDLDDLAQKTTSEKGYLVEIAGFADTTGKVTLNQELSQKRANAVIQYLEETGNIPIHRILTPTGLGTSHEAADNKTAEGRKMNRRVEVKVLVNQGLVSSGAGGASAAAPASTSAPASSSTPATPATPPTTPQQ